MCEKIFLELPYVFIFVTFTSNERVVILIIIKLLHETLRLK